MTDNVVSLASRRPHLHGAAFCVTCRHEWIAVVPAGDGHEWLECPKCMTQKGRMRYAVSLPADEQIWTCNCGNTLFHLSRTAWLCPNCGEYQQFP